MNKIKAGFAKAAAIQSMLQLSLQVLGSTKGQSHPVGKCSSTIITIKETLYLADSVCCNFVAIASVPTLDRASSGLGKTWSPLSCRPTLVLG
jgi:hypothetical protein